MKMLIKILISTLSVLVAAYFVPGVFIESIFVAVVVAIVLGILNTFLRPVLVVITLPINIITLGLFSLVINILLIMLTDYLVAGFSIDTLLHTILFGLVVSITSSVLSMGSK